MARLKFDKDSITALSKPKGANRIDYAEDDVRGFAVQTTNAGAKRFLLVYVAKETGRERRMVLGEFGAAPKLTVSAARRLAAEKRALVDLGRDPWLEAKELRAANEADAARRVATLSALMAAYVAHLKAARKVSWKEVEGAFYRHVAKDKGKDKAFPNIAKLQADAVTVDDVMPAVRKLTSQEKYRAAEKLVIYLKAAYNAATSARFDGTGGAFDGIDIRENPLLPLTVTRPEADPDEAPSAALSETELRAYWNAIEGMDTPHGALMRLHLLSGGQRMEQLSRLTVANFDGEAGTVTLWDIKGKRKKPRSHVLPLLADAAAAIGEMRGEFPAGPYLFTVSQGAAPAVPHTLASAVRQVSALLVEQGAVRTPITPGTIRRTVETRLAAVGVPMEVRAQLQSHGLGGVQARHYDRHDYLPEKRAALEKLRAMLEPRGNVIDFPARIGK